MKDETKGTTKGATDRRAFLAAAGKFAAVTPPAMTMLLSTSLTSPAIAASGDGGGFTGPVGGSGPPGGGPPGGGPPGGGPPGGGPPGRRR